MMCIFPPLQLTLKAKAIFAVVLFVAGTLATCLMSQDITVQGKEQNPEIGRLYDIKLSAELERDGSKIPADSILVFVDGDCDYRLYENSTVVAFVPRSEGVIEIRIVAIWFDLRIATQIIEQIDVGIPKPRPDPRPGEPKPEPDDLKKLTEFVLSKSKEVDDSYTRAKLQQIYQHCSESVRSSSPIVIEYFEDKRSLSTKDFDDAKLSTNIAVSRTIAYAKAVNRHSDKSDWEGIFLQPLKQYLDANIDLSSRDKLADVLAAISDGLEG